MKKGLFLLLLSSVLFTACLSEEPSGDETDSGSSSASDDEEMVTVDTLSEGDFTFIHKTQGENYYVEILYKDQTVGQLFKELPVDGWNVSVFEQTDAYAYIALEPTGLGGSIPFGGPPEVFRVNLESLGFETLTFNGHATDIADDDSAIVYFSDVLPTLQVMDITGVTYPNGSNVSSYTPEGYYQHVGNAIFSPDGAQLAYVALSDANNESAEVSTIFTVDLATGVQTELITRNGQLKITGWTGAEPSYE